MLSWLVLELSRKSKGVSSEGSSNISMVVEAVTLTVSQDWRKRVEEKSGEIWR